MQRRTTKRAAPSPTEAASKYHERNHTPPARRGASPGRRFGPNMGEAIIVALAFNAAAGGQRGIAAQ